MNPAEMEGARENTITTADVASDPTSAATIVVTSFSEARFWYISHQSARLRTAAMTKSHIFKLPQLGLNGRKVMGDHYPA
jgi:hypothetical protein